MSKSLRISAALAAGVLALAPLGASGVAAATTTPGCIVSLSPSATDTLYAIGAGSQVQAVDQDSNYPHQAAALARRHVINALEPSVESLLGICRVSSSHPSTKPDLVVIAYNASNLEQKLAAQGVKVVDQDAAASVAGALAQIRDLGRLTGHSRRANALAASMNSAIKAAIASVPAHPARKITVFYEVSANPYYSLTSRTFVGSIMKRMGLVNIADADATSADAGYPELSPEYIVHANPALVLLAGDAAPASVAARPGWKSITAVKDGNVLELNADVASQWGPRFVDLVRAIATEVRHVERTSAT